LLINRTLSQIAYSDIKEIKRTGRGKILAEMKLAKAANSSKSQAREKKLESVYSYISHHKNRQSEEYSSIF